MTIRSVPIVAALAGLLWAAAPTGTQEMVALLRRIIAARSLQTDRFLNLERAAQYRALLAHGLDFRSGLQVRMALAEELLQAGDPVKAKDELLAVREFVKGHERQLPQGFERELGDELGIAWLKDVVAR